MVNGISLYKSFLEVYDKKIEDQKRLDVKVERKDRDINSEKKDQISLSSEAQVLSKIKGFIEQPSDERAKRIEELKNMIQSGEYKVDSKQIASKLIDEVI